MSKSNEITAFVSEIFSSAQGEGVQIGRRQLFVRLCECHRNCLYCDTPVERSNTAAIEYSPGSGHVEQRSNPFSVEQLTTLLAQLNLIKWAHDDLFITGGEPLLQVDFLTHFLPTIQSKLGLPIHLETSGDLPNAFARIADQIDHVLMDIKLPSVTGEPETWDQHREFLDLIHHSATLKLVVSADTLKEDLLCATEIIQNSTIETHVVLQPITAVSQTDRVPTAQQILTWQSEMASMLDRCVRIIPQCHKLMGLS